jgi:hypothetical protein
MPTLTNVRDAIDKLLTALDGGADIGDGVTLRIRSGTTATVCREEAGAAQATLAFDPPPELLVRRGVVHLRCTLRGVTIGTDEVCLAIDGWFDRRWRVES